MDIQIDAKKIAESTQDFVNRLTQDPMVYKINCNIRRGDVVFDNPPWEMYAGYCEEHLDHCFGGCPEAQTK